MGTSTERQTSPQRDPGEHRTRTLGETERRTSDFEATRPFYDWTPSSSDGRMPQLSSGSPNTQVISKTRSHHPCLGEERIRSFVGGREEASTTAAIWCSVMDPADQETAQGNFNRGRRKENAPEEAVMIDNIWRLEHLHKALVSIPSRPSTMLSSPRCSPPRRSTTGIALKAADWIGHLFGYILTGAIVNSRRSSDHSWSMDLPLMKQLSPGLTDPPPHLALLQFAVWSLIGISHIPRSPRYWPECGLVACAISTGTGAWFGLDTMVDALIVTAYLSLLLATAVDWASGRIQSSGVVLPLSEQDCRGEKYVS
jgi:hypothetical protein